MNFLTGLHPLATLMSERLISCLLAGSILAVCAWAALCLIGRQNSRTRFALCFATLIAIAAVPFVGFWRGAHSSVSTGSAAVQLPADWAVYIFGAWTLVAAFALLRVALGIFQLQRVRRTCVPVDPAQLDPRLRHTLLQLSSDRKVELCTSPALRVPTAMGLYKPAVVLPDWCLRELSSDELHSVVLHEAEHLRRFDDWTNLLQRIVGALFFFHPAVWWLENRLSLEREMACDDAVLAQVDDPKAYARCLVSLAEKSYVRRGLAFAQAAVSRVQQLSARIAQILDASRPRNNQLWKPAFWVVAVASLAGGASVSVAPRLIAFQSDAPIAQQIARPILPTESNGTVAHSYKPVTLNDDDSAPRIVPARFTAPATSPLLRPHLAPHKNVAAAAKATESLLAQTDQLTPAPPSVNVALKQDAMPEATLVMVVHTEQHDESGMIFWSVRVVRFTVFHPLPQNRVADPAVPAKT